jgi:hypothetical protein
MIVALHLLVFFAKACDRASWCTQKYARPHMVTAGIIKGTLRGITILCARLRTITTSFPKHIRKQQKKKQVRAGERQLVTNLLSRREATFFGCK